MFQPRGGYRAWEERGERHSGFTQTFLLWLDLKIWVGVTQDGSSLWINRSRTNNSSLGKGERWKLYKCELIFTSDAPRRHPGGAEPNPTARRPASPESPPTSGRGSGEQERPRRTSSGEAGSSQQEEEDALQEETQRQAVMDVFRQSIIISINFIKMRDLTRETVLVSGSL